MSIPVSPTTPESFEYSPSIRSNPESPSSTIFNIDRARYRWTRELDILLREGYRGGPDAKQRAIDQICLRTGWPRQACWDRARALDLVISTDQHHRRQWRDEEIARILSHRPRQRIAELAAELGRSVRSVREKLKRLNKNRGEQLHEDNDHVFYSVTEGCGGDWPECSAGLSLGRAGSARRSSRPDDRRAPCGGTGFLGIHNIELRGGFRSQGLSRLS